MIKRPIKLARLKTIRKARKGLFRKELEKHGFITETTEEIRKNHPALFGGREWTKCH